MSQLSVNGVTATLEQRPFRHSVIDGLWEEEMLLRVREEFPEPDDSRWIRYTDPVYEEKLEGPPAMFGPATQELVKAIDEIEPTLREAFGLPPMVLSTEGGGYHQTNPGGGLAVHADFNRSEEGLYRRLNVIIYLNRPEERPVGGELQLWDAEGPVVEVSPSFNRTLIFETHDTSFHGHPQALQGPHPRRSFAAYFFTDEAPEHYRNEHSTIWHPLGTRPAQ